MNRIVIAAAALALLTPSAAWSMGQQAKKGPTVHTFTAPEDAFLVSSYAFESDGEILLVDAQMVKPQVDKLIEQVKKIPGKVTTIYITHAHPDHYLGLPWLKTAFPQAKIVADADTVDRIAAEGAQTLAWFQKDFMNGQLASVLPTSVVTPEKLTGNKLKVGSAEIEILSFADAEAKGAHALWHAQTGSLITGDLAFNKVHLWLKETKPEGWIKAIEALEKMPVQKVYPGHGEPGGKEILASNKSYLQAFDAAVKSSKDGAALAKTVKESNAGWRVAPIVDFAVPTYFSAPAEGTATDAKDGVKTETKTDSKTESKSDAKPGAKSDAKSDAKSESKTDAGKADAKKTGAK